ncbi:2'-5' RNA ligase family protein [Comamonas sp. GB3 AK4-5]|uniref:2'-5' RNA ligase family protein n=1 Tax=Comamonas sp. GB3 AK4-5 TaxID=3231487 RepID=UPI00351F4DDA
MSFMHTGAMEHVPSLTQPCEDRDFAEWHQGCPWCAVWVVLVHDAAVAASVQAARHALGAALLPRYARQPHLTLAYRGLCAADGHPQAEFGAARLQADLAALQALQQLPFSVQLQGLGSFTTVPYLCVTQGAAELAGLHQALQRQPPVAGWRYVPHLTLGHYAQALPMLALVERLHALGIGQPALPLQVEQLALVRYATQDIAGPLTAEGVWDLQQQRYFPAPEALLALQAA